MSACLRSVAALGLLTLTAAAVADDTYYRVPLGDLKLTEGKLPAEPTDQNWRLRETAWCMVPYAVLDGEGEIYVATDDYFTSWHVPRLQRQSARLLVRTEKASDLTGRLFYPKPDWSGMVMVRFAIPATEAQPSAREVFLHAKQAHYEQLLQRNIPGGAWFRHEVRQTEAALNTKPADISPNARQPRTVRPNEIEDTYAIFSGGRAVSENLQLDRPLPNRKPDPHTVDIATLQGITVQEIDWKPLVKDLKPALDPLAALIPANQHVVFFPTFSAAVTTADEADRQGTPLLHLAEPRSEDAQTAHRYQRQLCLSLTGLGRLLGPKVARSVALTGSDTYFRTGTDLAVLFEAPNPALLETLLLAQISMAAKTSPQAKAENGQVEGLAYHGLRSSDRSVCSYVARLDNAVVVTNSLYQLGRLASVHKDRSKSVAALPEYVFFRNRYRLGDPDETAMVFLSDATIRRWCSPRWRIATSRQTRDLAVMSELQAAQLDRLVKGTAQPGPLYADLALSQPSELTLGPDGVHSSVHGSLGFLTPIAELTLTKVTQSEAEAYRQWRDGYQRNWRWAFDPIALRVGLHAGKLTADLTVMPLIWGTDYREFVSVSRGATLAPDAGDRHDALGHFALALNPQSPTFRQAENFASHMSQGVTLGWIGRSMAVYADSDPFWLDLAKVPEDKVTEFMEKEIGRVPVAVRVEVASGLKLTLFLASLRAFIDQTAPDMTRWESLTYKDQPYVKISPTERGKGMNKSLEKLAIYYAASGEALVVTLNEKVLQRAIDRQLARKASEANKDKSSLVGQPWLGASMGLEIERGMLELIARGSSRDYQATMQSRAWANLPIMNEWKRRYPDQDPVELHGRHWQIRLICPGGGKYVWNEQWQTMESTVYGHPGQPKPGPAVAPALLAFQRGAFGLTFEDQGLRARVVLERAAPAK